jgi:hypothetical protein
LDEKLAVDGDKICYAKSKDSELWVMLLEKYYAKVYGGYNDIEGGRPHLALRDLTGAPSFILGE